MQPPQRGEPARRNGVAKRVGRAAQRARGLVEIVLQQPRFGEHRADGELVVARQRRAQRRREHLRRFGAAAALERRAGARQQRLQGRRRHAASINERGLESIGLKGCHASERASLCREMRSRRAVQSQSLQAHGSLPFRSRQRLRACASWTFSSVEIRLPSTRVPRRAASRRNRPRPIARGRRRARGRSSMLRRYLVARDRSAAERSVVDARASSACLADRASPARSPDSASERPPFPARRLDQPIGFGRTPRSRRDRSARRIGLLRPSDREPASPSATPLRRRRAA